VPKKASNSSRTTAAANAAANGRVVHNLILLALPRKARDHCLARMEFIELPNPSVLTEKNAPIEHGYFVNSGLASILSVLGDGKSVEVGLSGNEGFVGLPLIVGFKTSPTRIIMLVEGSAFRITAKDLAAMLRDFPQLEKILQRYSQEVALQSVQVAACNRVHEVSRRLARWLLMSQDRLSSDLVPLTQEFLAHMLGTRRASVTVAAGALQKLGLISYVRGQLKVEDRKRLENASCECYAILQRQALAWKTETK
jgi:CRP-like cAMP-binding protein